MVFFQKIFISLLQFLSVVVWKKVVYVNNGITLWSTAVLSHHGFWYVGNNYEYADISYGIINRGEIEKEGQSIKDLLEKIFINKEHVVFYDIGANTWYFGILASFFWAGRVITHFFEPVPEHVDCIKKSIYLNRIDQRAFTHEIGLADENDKKVFFTAGSWSSLDESFIGKDAHSHIEIQVRRLDDYAREQNMEKPDFLKIDIEWYEYFMLKWWLETIAESHPIVYVEIAKDLSNIGRSYTNKNYTAIFDLMRGLWYSSYILKSKGEVEYFDPDSEVSHWVNMYIFLHLEEHNSLLP